MRTQHWICLFFQHLKSQHNHTQKFAQWLIASKRKCKERAISFNASSNSLQVNYLMIIVDLPISLDLSLSLLIVLLKIIYYFINSYMLLLLKNCSAGRGGDWAERAVVKRRRRPSGWRGGAMSESYRLMAADAIQTRETRNCSLHRRGPQRHSTVVCTVR